MQTNQIPRAHPEIVSRILENEAVLVHPQRGKVKVLNEVGARIWTLIDGARTAGEIAARIAKDYPVPPAQAEIDTLDFLGTLHRRGLISLVENP